MALVLSARGTSPVDVARAAARVAELALQRPDSRFWAQRAVAPYTPDDPDDAGRWYGLALGRWAQSVAPLREPARYGEIVAAPWRTIAYRSGDCDDVAAAVAMMAAMVGMAAAIAVYATGPGTAHCVALISGTWGDDGAPSSWFQVDQAEGLQPFRPPATPFLVSLKR